MDCFAALAMTWIDMVSHPRGADGEGRRCLDLRADRSLDRGYFAGQLPQNARVSLSNKGQRLMFLLHFQTGSKIDQAFASLHQRLDFLMRGILDLAWRLAECLGKPGDHLRVNLIVFCKASSRFREAPNPFWIDNSHFETCLTQRLGPGTLVAAACLHHRLADLMLAKPRNQTASPRRGRREGPPLCYGPNACIHLVLGNIDPDDNQIILCHHPLPSLPGTGLKLLQLFGLRKTPELSLALFAGSVAFGRNGLSSGNGRLVRTARCHILADFRDTRAQGRPGACCTRGLACDLRKQNCTRAYRAAGASRPSLRNGFTAYFVLFPENGSFASVASEIIPPT